MCGFPPSHGGSASASPQASPSQSLKAPAKLECPGIQGKRELRPFQVTYDRYIKLKCVKLLTVDISKSISFFITGRAAPAAEHGADEAMHCNAICYDS